MRNQAQPAVETAFLNVQNAAAYLGISVNTLYIWRHRRQGPPSFRMGPGVGSCIAEICSTHGCWSSKRPIRARIRFSTR